MLLMVFRSVGLTGHRFWSSRVLSLQLYTSTRLVRSCTRPQVGARCCPPISTRLATSCTMMIVHMLYKFFLEKSQDFSSCRAICPFVLGNPAPGRGEFCKIYMGHVLWMLPWTLLPGKSPSPSVFSLLINLALQQV